MKTPGFLDDPIESKWKEWKKSGDENLFDEVLGGLSDSISSGITTFAGGRQAPSVTSRAKILASRAVKKWDPKGGSKLKNYVFNQLQPLTRFSARAGQAMPLPEKAESELRRIYQAQTELAARYGRDATVEELCDHLNLSKARLEKIRTRYSKPTATEGQAEEYSMSTPVHGPDWQSVWKDYVYLDLEPIDKKIFEWRTGYAGTNTLDNASIARRLRISPSAVSQRAARIDKALAEGFNYRQKEG